MAARLNALPGVVVAEVNFTASKLKVTHHLNSAEIIAAISKAGYSATLLSQNVAEEKIEEKKLIIDEKLQLILSLLFWLIAVILPGTNFSLANKIFYTAAIICAGWKTAFKGIQSLFYKELDMNFLMTIAVGGALLLGQWSEATAVTVLFAIGEFLESFSMQKTRRALNKMLDLAPKQATVLEDGMEKQLAVEKVIIGSILLVRPGEGIPLDGRVVRGLSDVNQAAITGESAVVNKNCGDEVFAGTQNVNGILEILTTSTVADTTLAKVRELVEEAQTKKAISEKLIDKFARIYTPVVTILATLTVLIPVLLLGKPFSVWFYRALVLLVIACPCALVISTPVAVVSAIGNAARKGMLVKGGTFLEKVAKVKVIAFDKTGTLTIGKPRVVDVIADNKEELLCYAASLEKGTKHPLAEAVLNYATAQNINLLKISDFQNFPGLGAAAKIDGKTILVGSRKLLADKGVSLPKENSNNTVIAVAKDGKFLGTVIVEDTVRQESKDVLEKLAANNITPIMLTGDNQQIATKISRDLGNPKFYAELLPQQKLKIIRDLKKKKNIVAMVGDGINDAPALVEADIGIAMGKVGTDIAIESADIVLMHDDLKGLHGLLLLAKKLVLIVKLNIIFAITVKVIFMFLALYGYSNLWMAVFADTGMTLLVTANGMRLAR